MKKGDLWLIGVIGIAAAGFLLFSIQNASVANVYEGRTYARITVDGKLHRMVELGEAEQRIEVRTEFGYNLLRAADGGIQMIEADCPDDICIAMGFKDSIGETIVCLPNRVLVEIVGEPGEGGEHDAVAT